MANKKISELPYISNGDIGNLDLVPLVTYFSSVTGDTVHTYVSDLQSYILSATPLSYSSFTTLISNSGLTQGSFYLINNFQTCYDQPDFDINGNSITTGNYKQGPVEPILVLATSNSTISEDAYQPDYPNDKIKYDWTWDLTEVTSGTSYGRITERIDEFNNRTDYDHRNILFKRYRLYTYRDDLQINGTVNLLPDGSVSGTGTYFTALTVGDVIYINSASPYLYEITGITDNTNMSVSGDTIGVATNSNFYRTIEETNGSNGYFSYMQTNVKTSDFSEYTTFGDAILSSFAKNNYIGNYANDYTNIGNGTFILPNNVFLEGGYENNKIGNYSYNNTFGTDNSNNIFGDFCFQNVSTNDIDDNIIGTYFTGNLINTNFRGNFIGDGFENNFLLSENGSSFESNRIGNGFYNNTIFSTFIDNDIKNYFNFNEIGDYGNLDNFGFNGNNIGNYFEKNIIGGNFENNNIKNYFLSNIIGNNFENNEIGDYFGNYKSSNIIGGYFQNNKIGNYFGNDGTNNNGGNLIGVTTTMTYTLVSGIPSGITLTNGGTGYIDSTNVVTTGGAGSSLTVDIVTDGLGVITGVTINTPGTYYSIGDTITITTGGNDATFDITGITSFVTGDVIDNGAGATAEIVTDDGFSSSTINVIMGGVITGTIDNNAGVTANVIDVTTVPYVSGLTQGNVIGNYFINNQVGNNFENNQIGNYFGNDMSTDMSNIILDNFKSNNIANYFGIDVETPSIGEGGNIIRSNFIGNTIGDSFTYNITFDTSGGGYYNNTIGWGCNTNTFGDGFNYNRIGDLFQENLIGPYFGGNEIGYFFNSNQIDTNAGFNKIGDLSWFNTIGTGFESNHAGDSFFANTIGINFAHNTIGNFFGQFFAAGNTWGDDVYDNRFGDHTYANNVSSNFNNNNIFNNFIGNTVGANFQYNTTQYDVSVDFTLNPATHVYNPYSCTIFQNSVSVLRLSYIDNTPSLVVVDPAT